MEFLTDFSGWYAGLEATYAGDHMTPMGMFFAADILVKSVMVSLAVASVFVWGVFLLRLSLLALARRRIRGNYRALNGAGGLEPAAKRLAKERGVVGAMVRAAQVEVRASKGGEKAGIKERVDSALDRISAGATRGMQRGTSVLAITGSSAPFVGLFGTVWGIMNSFVAIAETNTTNLAVVAPGIAEALLATAIGLVTAIPAVIFYNILARSTGTYKAMVADSAALVSRHLSRDLDLEKGQDTGVVGTQDAATKPLAETAKPTQAAA